MTTPKLCSFFFSLFAIISTTMTSSKRASRRNWRGGASNDWEPMMHGDEGGVCELEVSCKNRAGMPVTLPVKGPKGTPGKPGTPGVPGLPGKQGPAGQSGTGGEEVPKVAFFVGLKANQGPIKKNSDLIFDKIITNVGDAFNPKTGRFRAPVNGTYQFTITVAAPARQRAAVEIVHNKKMVVTVWAESIPFWDSASNSLVLALQEGDQVWAVILSRASNLHGYMYTSFSGHYLFRSV